MSSSLTGSTGNNSGWAPPSVEELQQLLPQYEIESILGKGGMGAVYKGKQAALQRPVAIKVLPETLIEGDNDHQYVERFKLEARAMANLDHPAIISVHDFGQTTAGHLYFVMEFIDGMDIEQYITASGGKVDPEHAVAIVSHVLDALDYAHSQGIVHRDIKPANVLINNVGRVKIADFGLAKEFGGEDSAELSGLTMTNMAMGTPDYIAPEALETDSNPDHRADLYAVGVMFFKMLTGKLPRGMFKLPSEQIAGLDERFDDIIALAMESEPDGRFQSASEFRYKLDELQSAPVTKMEAQQDSGEVSPAVSGRVVRGRAATAPKTKDPAKKSPVIYVGITIAVLIAAGIFSLNFFGPKLDRESFPPPEIGKTALVVAPAQTPSKSPLPAKTPTIQPEPSKPESTPQQVSNQPDLHSTTKAPITPNPRIDNRERVDGLVANGEWIDLLPAIGNGLQSQTKEQLGVRGKVQYAEQVLTMIGGSSNVGMAIHSAPLAEYSVRIRFQSQKANSFVVLLPTPSGGMGFGFNYRNKDMGLFDSNDVDLATVLSSRKPLPPNLLLGEEQELIVSVRRDGISATLDGLAIYEWTNTDWSAVAQPHLWTPAHPVSLGVGANSGTTEVTAFEVRVSSGTSPNPATTQSPESTKIIVPDIPDLHSRLSSYRQYRKQTIGSLISGYRKSLTRVKETAISAGDLTGVEQADREITALGTYSTELGILLSQEEVKPLPLPGAGSPSSVGAELLRTKFLKSLTDAETDMQSKLDQSLGICQTTLTKENQIESAREVREFRNQLLSSLPRSPEQPGMPPAVNTPSSDWIDMIAAIDPSRDKSIRRPLTPESNIWKKENGELVFPTNRTSGEILLPGTDGISDFELKFSFTRVSGEKGFDIKLPIPTGGAPIWMGKEGYRTTMHGFAKKESVEYEDFLIEDGKKVVVVLTASCTGSNPGITLTANGKQLIDWKGDYRKQYPVVDYRSKRVGLWIYGAGSVEPPAHFRFHEILFRPLNETETRPLSNTSSEKGWIPLTNGRNFEGWSGPDLAEWSIESGGFISSQAKAISTPFPHQEFEMEGEFYTSEDGNGGIFFLDSKSGTFELALIGSNMIKARGGNVFTGGLFQLIPGTAGNRISPKTNLHKDDSWSEFRLQVTTERITTWINGTQALEHKLDKVYTGTAIQLQGGRLAGSKVGYRNLRIRPISPSASIPATAVSSDDWIDLFNGRDLSQWKFIGDSTAFPIEDGVLKTILQSKSPAFLCLTLGQPMPVMVKNFEMRLEVKSSGKANSGVYFHVDPGHLKTPENPKSGHEVQLANIAPPNSATGSLFSAVPPKFQLQNQDEWFQMYIKVEGQNVRCEIDGKVILDYTESLNSATRPGPSHKWLRPEGGQLAIQSNATTGAWYFKSIQFRQLP